MPDVTVSLVPTEAILILVAWQLLMVVEVVRAACMEGRLAEVPAEEGVVLEPMPVQQAEEQARDIQEGMVLPLTVLPERAEARAEEETPVAHGERTDLPEDRDTIGMVLTMRVVGQAEVVMAVIPAVPEAEVAREVAGTPARAVAQILAAAAAGEEEVNITGPSYMAAREVLEW